MPLISDPVSPQFNASTERSSVLWCYRGAGRTFPKHSSKLAPALEDLVLTERKQSCLDRARWSRGLIQMCHICRSLSHSGPESHGNHWLQRSLPLFQRYSGLMLFIWSRPFSIVRPLLQFWPRVKRSAATLTEAPPVQHKLILCKRPPTTMTVRASRYNRWTFCVLFFLAYTVEYFLASSKDFIHELGFFRLHCANQFCQADTFHARSLSVEKSIRDWEYLTMADVNLRPKIV